MPNLARCFASLALALLTCSSCSKRIAEPISESHLTASPTPAAASAVSADASPQLVPTQLLTLPSSAYQASLFVDDEAVELLTNTVAYRLVPGKDPVPRALDLGFARTVTHHSYVYWSNGAIWSAPRGSATANASPRRILTLSHQPQRFVADIDDERETIAWLDRSEDDHYALNTAQKQGVKRLYTSPGSIDALALAADAVYFVERPEAQGFRIGRVALADGATRFTASKSGRWPAMLSASKEVVYYDGSSHEVLALSLDLQHERRLAKDLICSPLAVTANVYCSAMNRLFEVPESGAAAPRQVVTSPLLITSLAAHAERLAWIVDSGGRDHDQLLVNTLTLEEADATAPP